MSDIYMAKSIHGWQYGCSIIELDNYSYLELVVLFDHDYQFHILFREPSDNALGRNGFYSLWFLGINSDGLDGAYLVKRWKNQMLPPFVEASEIVQEWIELCVADNERKFGE